MSIVYSRWTFYQSFNIFLSVIQVFLFLVLWFFSKFIKDNLKFYVQAIEKMFLCIIIKFNTKQENLIGFINTIFYIINKICLSTPLSGELFLKIWLVLVVYLRIVYRYHFIIFYITHKNNVFFTLTAY